MMPTVRVQDARALFADQQFVETVRAVGAHGAFEADALDAAIRGSSSGLGDAAPDARNEGERPGARIRRGAGAKDALAGATAR